MYALFSGSDYAQTLAPIRNALRITSGQLPPSALGAYVPATRAGSLVFTAGQLPLKILNHLFNR